MSERKKLFVVSDIHGHCTILKKSLEDAGFDRKNKEHLLICCGDFFDRGNENLEVLKYIDCLDNKVMLFGNHEEMLLRVLETGRLQEHNVTNGTVQTIKNLFGKYSIDEGEEIDFSGKTRILDRVTDFIGEMRNYFETEHYVFVHGWLPTNEKDGMVRICSDWRNAGEGMWENARWTHWTDMYEKCDRLPDKTIVCGHVPTYYASRFDTSRPKDSYEIFCGDGMISIDAGTITSGVINVLVIEDEPLLKNRI